MKCTMCLEDKNADAFPDPGDVCWECHFPLMVGRAVMNAVLKEQDRILEIAQRMYDQRKISAIANMWLVHEIRNINGLAEALGGKTPYTPRNTP